MRAVGCQRRSLRHLDDFAEHLAGTGLIHANAGVDDADGVQHARDAQGGHIAGKNRLIPRGLDKRLGGQVIDFIGLILIQDADQRDLVTQVARNKLQSILDVADTVEVEGARAAHHTNDAVAAVEQELGQIGTVLSGDARNQCCGHVHSLIEVSAQSR